MDLAVTHDFHTLLASPEVQVYFERLWVRMPSPPDRPWCQVSQVQVYFERLWVGKARPLARAAQQREAKRAGRGVEELDTSGLSAQRTYRRYVAATSLGCLPWPPPLATSLGLSALRRRQQALQIDAVSLLPPLATPPYALPT